MKKRIFKFPPQVKQRPRMTRRGRVFTPAKTLEFEAKVAKAWRFKPIEGDVVVEIHLHKDTFTVSVDKHTKDTVTKLRGDIDNYVKAILDGLNGVAFTDDKYIRELIVIKD